MRFRPAGGLAILAAASLSTAAPVDAGPADERRETERLEPRVVMTGLAFPESPRWHGDRLWLSDWGTGEVVTLDPDGHREVVARVDSFPMCIDHLPDGRLLVVDSDAERLLRQEPDGSLVRHADLGGIAETPWNEVAVDDRGNAYVNNVGFDFPDGEFAPGFLVLVSPDGSTRRVADDLAFPNGMVVTGDGSTLIVAESYGERLTAFDIGEDGSLSGRRVWAALEGNPDGICLDAEGAIWYGDVPGQRCVRVREGGEVLQAIALDRGCFACALGGQDGRTLFLVANAFDDSQAGEGEPRGQVLTVDAPAPGVDR